MDSTSVHPQSIPKPEVQISNNARGFSVAKVRWLSLLSDSFYSPPNPFAKEYSVTGSSSWEDNGSDVILWELKYTPILEEEGKKQPQVSLINTATVPGSVNGIAVNGIIICVCTSEGTLHVFTCNVDADNNLGSLQQSASCQLVTRDKNTPTSAIAIKEDIIITVGENGSIYESWSAGLKEIRRYENADPVSISEVCFLNYNEFMTGNEAGQVKLWDLRSSSDKPTKVLNPNMLMNKLCRVNTICQHPSLKHAVIVGYQSGFMDVWDIRDGHDLEPVASFSSQGGPLSEVYFHQMNPDHLFTCAQSGQVRHWCTNSQLCNPFKFENESKLDIEFLTSGLVYKEIFTSSFPMTSMSLSKNDRLVAASETGLLFCTEIAVQRK